MRKWLVGLLALACAASAWATTDVLTAADLAATSTTYTEFSNVTKDSGAVYAGKSSKSSAGAIQLRTTGNDCGIVTTESGGTATKVTLAWNDATDDAREVSVYGNSEAYTAASDLYSADAQGTLLGSLKKGDGATELEIEGEYAYIGLRSKSGALYLDSVEIEWAGGTPPVFSVKLDPAEDFEVIQGKSASITATVKGAQGDVTYSWSVNGTPIDLAGNVYTVDSAELGEYEVAVEVSDGVADPLSASVKYTVVEAPVVTGDVLTRETTGVSGTSYKDWTATGDSGAEYAGNSAGGNDSIQMRTTNPSGIVITKSSGKDVASVTVEWNDATAAEKRSLEIYGSTEAYAGPAALYEASTKGELLGTIARDGATLEIPEGYPYVGVLAKGGAVYLTSVAFDFGGEAGLSVTLDKDNGFTVDLGTADSITATAKNGVEPYTYAWTSDTPDLNGTGETLAIPATLAEGDYTVQVEVTDAESNKANKQIYFSVVAPAQKYAVNVAIGILNGGVTADKEQAEEGELVTLTASADAGYKLGTFLLDGEAIEGNTFNMPAHDVLVSAEFVEVTGEVYELVKSADDFEEGAEYLVVAVHAKGNFTSALKNEANGTRIGVEEVVVNEDNTVVTDDDSIVWTIQSGAEEGQYVLYNVAQGVYAAATKDDNVAQLLEDGTAALAQWTLNFDNVPTVGIYSVSYPERWLSRNSTAASAFFATYKGTQTAPFLFKKAGPSGPSVSLSASATEVEVNEPVTITATAKNFSADVEWAWEGNDGGSADGAVYTVNTAVAGEFTIKATATAGDEIAEKSVTITVSEPAVKYAVNVAIGILNGGVTADKEQAEEGELVTLTASADAGYKLGTFLLDGEAIEGNTFNMPAHDVLVSAEFIVKPVVAGFTKITSLDELTEGEYVITGAKAAGEEYAMMASVSDGKTAYLQRREAAVEIEEDVVTDAEDSIIWTLAQGADGWTIYNEAVGYAGYVASGNSSGAEAEPSAKSSWTITASDSEGLFLLTNVGDTGRYLLYNASSPRFACYEKTTSGKQLALYKGSSGPAVPSVSLSASATEVEVNEPVTITATAKNFSAEPEWSWTGNGSADGATFAVDTTVAGVYEVTATATAGEETASKSVTITVKEPAVKYAVTVEQAAGGTIAVDKAEAEAGETVTVTATADDGMRLVAITVNGSPIEGNSFEMPAEPVTVSATFEEFEVPPYYFQFESNDLPTAYSATEANVANTGSTAEEVPTVPFALQRAVRGNASGDKTVGAAALRLAPIGETNAFAYNSAAFSEAITAISFQYGIYGASDKCDSFTVSTSEDGEEWTVLADLTATATGELQTFESSDLPDNTLFIRFDATNTVAGNSRRMDIDEIQLWTGAPSPKIVYSGETSITLGDSFEIIFGLLNYDGDFEWVLDSREGGTIVPDGRDGLYTWTPTEATDGVTIKVVARNGELDIASKEVVLTVTEPGPQPGDPAIVIDGPASGVVGTELSCTVTAINMADPAVYFEGNFSSPEGSTLTTDGIVFEDGVCTFTPDIAGDYWIEFCAYEGDAGICDKWTVTVTDEPGPGGVFQITGVSATGGNLVLTFAGEGTPAVLGTASLASPQEWTPVEGVAVSGNSATVPMGAQNYITLK